MTTQPMRFEIDGMSCAGCAGRAERALAAVPGVMDARVNFAARSALVEAPDVTAQSLADALTSAGYPARVSETGTPLAPREDAEALEARRRFFIAGVFTLPVFVTEMGGHLVPALHHLIHESIGQTVFWTLQYLLVTLVLCWPGRDFFARGFPALFRGAPDMNSLVALGASAAWVYSSVALFAPALMPAGTRAVYFEAAAVIVTLILLGRWLEARARGQAGAAIRALVGLQPAQAHIRQGDLVTPVDLSLVRAGDILVVKPGDRVPVDGRVIEGRSFVDESMLTGEAVPVEKTAHSALTGGTLNGQGALVMEATHVGRDTVLARIVDMVQTAQGARLPIQSLADRVVGLFVPVVIVIAGLSVAAWLTFGPDPALSFALVAGVSVLIIACPCAMGLATPTSIMVGTGRAAELGVLFRKGEALQPLEEVRVLAFDKTGTLTQGRPEVAQIEVAEGADEAEVMRLVASAEQRSEHPIAVAILAAADTQLAPAEEVTALQGRGLSARVETREVLIGTVRLMAEHGVDTGDFARVAEIMTARAQTPVFAAIDGRCLMVLSVTDQVKDGAAEAIASLKAQGVQVAMLTGDTRATGEAIGATLGIDRVEAELLPGDKQTALAALRRRFGPVAFVGDGINDAPALALADVGIAVGSGTDVAIEAADIVLVSGDPRGVVTAMTLSARTMRNIRQNLFWAFAYNAALIPVAAGALYPGLGVMLSPMLAAGAMALSSVFVVTNSLRLRRVNRGARP
ncbi:MAG: heavy metal translocating P-type ATPase [Pseudomonadota bacterium]